MKIRASLAFLLLAGFPGAAVSSGQGPTREAISNWPAPAFWEPSSPEAFEISQPRAGVGPAGLLGEAAASPLPFVAMTPCRVVDTRGNGFTGAYGPPALAGNAPARTFDIPAEEVAEIYPELVVYDADGRPETIRYQLLDPLLLNEVQKQHRELEAQQVKLRQQSETIDHQEAEIDALKLRLSSVETRLLADMVP